MSDKETTSNETPWRARGFKKPFSGTKGYTFQEFVDANKSNAIHKQEASTLLYLHAHNADRCVGLSRVPYGTVVLYATYATYVRCYFCYSVVHDCAVRCLTSSWKHLGPPCVVASMWWLEVLQARASKPKNATWLLFRFVFYSDHKQIDGTPPPYGAA